MAEELSKDLLDVLACPVCKSDLNYNKKQSILSCKKCRVDYPIKEGIPVLLPQNLSNYTEKN